MSSIKRSILDPGDYNNYVLAGNITRAFAIGEVGSTDDFFLVGTEPPEEVPYPMLSGNILDSNGEVMFRLVKNIIVNNPKNCYKIIGDYIGYEIVDGEGQPILKVETKYEKLPNFDGEFFYTTIKANFYDKKKELVFHANSGEKDEQIEGTAKMMFGRALSIGYNDEERKFIAMILSTGNVYEPLRGEFKNQDIYLDGKCLIQTKMEKCRIFVSSGDFVTIGKYSMENCVFSFEGPAGNIAWLSTKMKINVVEDNS